MASLDITALKAKIDSLINTNGIKDITGAEMNEVLKDLIDSTLNLIDNSNQIGLSDYDETKIYNKNDEGACVIYNDEIYQAKVGELNITGVFNPLKWDIIAGEVNSVNGLTGNVVLNADHIDDSATTNKFVTAAQITLINSALQTGDNISNLINDANYLSSGDNISALVNDAGYLTTGDGDGIYDGSGTIPSSTIANLTDTFTIKGADNISNTNLQLLNLSNQEVFLARNDRKVSLNGASLANTTSFGLTVYSSMGSNGRAVTSNNGFFLETSGGELAGILLSSDAIHHGNFSNYPMNIMTNNTPRIGITENGQIIFGQDENNISTALRFKTITSGAEHSFLQNVYVVPNQDIDTDGELANSSSFNISAFYDSDPGAGITPARTEFTLQHTISVGGASPVSQGELVVGGTNLVILKSDGTVNMPNLPTSPAGLVSGDLWNNTGVINII